MMCIVKLHKAEILLWECFSISNESELLSQVNR